MFGYLLRGGSQDIEQNALYSIHLLYFSEASKNLTSFSRLLTQFPILPLDPKMTTIQYPFMLKFFPVTWTSLFKHPIILGTSPKGGRDLPILST